MGSRTSPKAAGIGDIEQVRAEAGGVARASLEELLLDYEDFLRQHRLRQWRKGDPEAQATRKLAYKEHRSYMTYRQHIEDRTPEIKAGNTMICLIHQTNYLLGQQLRQLEDRFLREGGFTERLYRARSGARRRE